MIQRFRMHPTAQPRNQVKDIHPASGADDAIQAGHLLHQGVAIALRQAAGRDHHLIRPLNLDQFAQGINRFLLGRIDEAAGIDDQHFG